MLLSSVVDVSRRIAETTKRTAKTDFLAGLLRQLSPEEIEVVVNWLSGTTRQGRVGIGYALLRDASSTPAVTSGLSVLDVDRVLQSFVAVKGSGSASRRRELLHEMFSRATESEQQFLRSLLAGELRQGALEGIMIDGIAKAGGMDGDRVRRAVMLAGDVATVARAVLEGGETALSQYDVQLFRPVQPMLAQTAEDVGDAIDELGEPALEYKFDGARIQVHRSGDDVTVYSRRMNDVTAAVPEVVESVRRLPVRDVILDGEVLSFDENGRPQPFQVTMRRFGRKLDVERRRSELPLTPVWFDLLFLDGGALIDEPQSRRFSALLDVAPPEVVVPHTLTSDRGRAEDFLHEALQRGHEGIMAKAAGAPYAAGARGQSWLKVKQARALDLVILAAEWGNGRRQGWLSNLHLGAWDVEKGGFAMLGKTFKGLTDQMLAWQTEELLKIEIARDSYTVYVEPKLVVEIAFNEIQVSPRYASGLALRFARVKRYRPDKSVADSDAFDTVKKLAGMIV